MIVTRHFEKVPEHHANIETGFVEIFDRVHEIQTVVSEKWRTKSSMNQYLLLQTLCYKKHIFEDYNKEIDHINIQLWTRG